MIKRLERIDHELARRNLYLYKEVKRQLLKSLITDHNNLIPHKIIYQKKRRKKITKISITRHQALCLLTGRARGVIREFGVSRQSLKRLALENKVQNIKVGSW